MNKRLGLIVCSALIFSGLAFSATPSFAQKKTIKACEEEWRANKAANEAAKITEKAYVAKCRADAEKPAAAAPPRHLPHRQRQQRWRPLRPRNLPTAGRQNMLGNAPAQRIGRLTRPRAEVPAGMTWPKYWSECDKRKKAAGM